MARALIKARARAGFNPGGVGGRIEDHAISGGEDGEWSRAAVHADAGEGRASHDTNFRKVRNFQLKKVRNSQLKLTPLTFPGFLSTAGRLFQSVICVVFSCLAALSSVQSNIE
ncbi:MAG: hypothetical protein OXQ86_08910 [Gammaproteobacteria bacterium]|nr:hypothetical protein [Gammaproteobacteria bacterium]